MKTVKTYEQWIRGIYGMPSCQEAWLAGQANMPTETCEWTEFDEGYINCVDSGRGTKTPHTDAFRITATAYCDNCGGKVTIKTTTEQKLEVMTRARDERERMANNYLQKLTDAQLKLQSMTKERDAQIANNKAIMAALSVVTKERSGLFTAVAAEKVWRETAEKHLKILVDFIKLLDAEIDDALLRETMGYILQNGLIK